MGTYTTGLEQQGIGALQALGAEGQALEQQKLNQLALGAQTGYQLPTQRIQDVANIYGGIAGAMPGSPTQKFDATPLATGIGGGLDAAQIMGMFGTQNTAAGRAPAPTPTGNYSRSYNPGAGGVVQHNI